MPRKVDKIDCTIFFFNTICFVDGVNEHRNRRVRRVTTENLKHAHRNPKAMTSYDFTVYFDGATSPNPGKGGFGLVVYPTDRTMNSASEHGPLGGTVTSNVAEYSGLIMALGVVLRLAKDPASKSIVVRGDSELVISQMLGTYAVRNQKLVPWQLACSGVASKFASVTYEHVARDENNLADIEAKFGAKRPPPIETGTMPVFYPSLANFMVVRVAQTRTLATHDYGANSTGRDFHMIDAKFLLTLPNGRDLLRVALPPPMAFVRGKVDMTAICLIPELIVDIYAPDDREATGTRAGAALQDVLVIDSLPVPLHVSLKRGRQSGAIWAKNATTSGFFGDRRSGYNTFGVGQRMERRNAPDGYKDHPYWTDETIFLNF